MTYVIAEPCVDLLDKACIEECPVDCIYEGGRMLYIHPDECVDSSGYLVCSMNDLHHFINVYVEKATSPLPTGRSGASNTGAEGRGIGPSRRAC